MTTVIDDDVDVRNVPFEAVPKAAVCLVTDEHFHSIVFVCLAGRLDVYAIDVARGSEVIFPHFQASTAVDADLQDVNSLASESTEVPVIDVKIMIPFPDTVALFAGLKKFSQGIRQLQSVLCLRGHGP